MIPVFKKLKFTECNKRIFGESFKEHFQENIGLTLWYRKTPNELLNIISQALFPRDEISYIPAIKVDEVQRFWRNICL